MFFIIRGVFLLTLISLPPRRQASALPWLCPRVVWSVDVVEGKAEGGGRRLDLTGVLAPWSCPRVVSSVDVVEGKAGGVGRRFDFAGVLASRRRVVLVEEGKEEVGVGVLSLNLIRLGSVPRAWATSRIMDLRVRSG